MSCWRNHAQQDAPAEGHASRCAAAWPQLSLGVRPTTKAPHMKAYTLAITSLLIAYAAHAGALTGAIQSKEMVAPPPCPIWYANHEWNVSLWGAYAFTDNDFNINEFVKTGHFSTGYLGSDDTWGGGIDAKYFFKRYFGIGIEGYVIDARRTVVDTSPNNTSPQIITEHHESRAIGSVLGTFTFRYPLPCSRFAPYAYIGGGAIFGGGQRDRLIKPPFFQGFDIEHTFYAGSVTSAA